MKGEFRMSEFRWRTVAATVAISAMAVWVAGAQDATRASAPAQTPRAPAPPPAAATVGALRIPQAELDQRSQMAVSEYRSRTGSDLPPEVRPLMRRQLLESLIRRDLLLLEAQRRGLLGSEQEAESQLKKDPFFQANGRFDPNRYEQIRLQNPALLAKTLQNLRATLGARDLLQRVQKERGPDEAGLRAGASRALTRASIDFLALARPETDESQIEPRAGDVLDYYRAHGADYQQPARATCSVVFVDQPALADSLAGIPAATAAWNARMKQRADSILAAVAAGRTLEEASQSLGGPRPNQVALPDNFPGYWQGGPATKAALFAAAPGKVLPQPVPAQTGWLVVRLDEIQPTHTLPLQNVAREIRSRLRTERRATQQDRELRALYDGLRDSLKVTGYRLRYAVADTSSITPGRPTAAEMDRYYRGHLADYSSFSSRDGGVVAKSLDEVRGDVESRMLNERRFEQSGAVARQLVDAWARGRRDAVAERRVRLREVGPLVPGLPADSGSVGRMLGDSLAQREGILGPGLARSTRGWVAFDIYQEVPGYLPSFEQARQQLVDLRSARRLQEDEEGARRLFDASPQRFVGGPSIHYSRAFVPIPNVLKIHLTRSEVERYHRDHMDRFSAPELVRASHILVSPRDSTPEADREARARADSLLERLRAGEDFADLAGRVTDDPATRGTGGDLGLFGRGTMLPEVERAAFAMRPGDLSSEPVSSPVGYHLLKAREYVPMYAQPLSQIYSDVAELAAREKADSMAMRFADSLQRVLKNASQARAAAKRMDLTTLSYGYSSGEWTKFPRDLQSYYQLLETLQPGQILPMTVKLGGMGYTLTWLDSISAPAPPTWEEARERALGAYRADAGLRALETRRAELDSLMRAGWSFDSVGVLWGGIQHAKDVVPGQRIGGIGTSGVVDTLLFGTDGSNGLSPGTLSDWITLAAGTLRVRMREIRPPDAAPLSARVESERRATTERALVGYFEELKKRYPVRIQDRTLRDVMLPTPPTPAAP
jgi:parvulin-like peptidyl-prolyl isomerase